jgi:hypothetical protein
MAILWTDPIGPRPERRAVPPTRAERLRVYAALMGLGVVGLFALGLAIWAVVGVVVAP